MNRKQRRSTALAALSVAVLITVSACGGDDDDATATPPDRRGLGTEAGPDTVPDNPHRRAPTRRRPRRRTDTESTGDTDQLRDGRRRRRDSPPRPPGEVHVTGTKANRSMVAT